jgi:hypothetical protein
MTTSKKNKVAPSKKLKPFMTYLDIDDYAKLKKFAKSERITMAQILREGLNLRMTSDNPYIKGFNDGLIAANNTVNQNQVFQMKFPSGQSFADLLTSEISKLTMNDVDGEAIK